MWARFGAAVLGPDLRSNSLVSCRLSRSLVKGRRVASTELFDLSGRRAVVTGASRGIGRAIAIAYASAGAKVCAVARSESDLAETRALAGAAAEKISLVPGDLSSLDTINSVVGQSTEAMGGIDVLVNNAGYDNEQTLERTTEEEWDKVLNLNVTAAARLCKASAPQLQDGGGKVINIASMFGIVTVRGEAAYTVSKHAIVGLTRSLALEWARKGVQVNAICPGFIETDMLASAVQDEATAAYMRRTTPLGRWAQPEEMAGPAIFLASAASNFMTGQLLIVDGGYTTQ